jgi:uncharacterized protein (DUF488 family)
VTADIFTIGHSTRTVDEFAALLRIHGIGQIADIRTVPQSTRHPHFSRDALAAFLAAHGCAYRHFPGLGGLRRPRPDSINTAWRNPGFRGYADHMQTSAFREALTELAQFASVVSTSVLCAEAVWWQCHRRLLADALVVRGLAVRHILSSHAAKPHELSEFARVDGDGVIYPGLL